MIRTALLILLGLSVLLGGCLVVPAHPYRGRPYAKVIVPVPRPPVVVVRPRPWCW